MNLPTLPTFSELANFHFLRPEWFIALVPLLILIIWLRQSTSKQSGWQSVIPAHLYQYMIIGKFEQKRRPPFWALGVIWFVGIVALAGPTWERLPQPVYQLKMGHVIVLDMSLSMRATDVKPDRMTRAKYKAIDLVNAIGEGEMGLVAYAGDAFVISPLTEDAGNVTSLIPSLSPEIMPVPGSDPLLGIERAAELLTNAGYTSGMIYWITDGIDLTQQKELQQYVSSIPFTLNALTVGTEQGAPIRQMSGELLKDVSGSIVIPKLNNSAVNGVVKASGGAFQTFTSNDDDVNALAKLSLSARTYSDEENGETNAQGDQWKEVGPYLLLIILPIAALAFRKGLLFIVLLCAINPLLNKPALAQQNSETETTHAQIDSSSGISWWQEPFLNDDQEALTHYRQGAFSEAANQFNDTTLKAASLYKSGDYQGALAEYQKTSGADSLYNQGNALAKLGKLEQAIDKYTQALALAPDMEDASANKALLEELLKQQQNQQQNDDNQQSDNQQQSGESDQSQDQQNQSGENDQPQQGEQNQQEQQNQNGKGQQENQQNEGSQQQENAPSNEQEEEGQDAQSEQQNQDSGEQKAQESSELAANGNEEGQETENNVQAMQGQPDELTDEQKEEQQRMENLMRRVPDDPAFLLKRKMQLEAQKRQRQRMPSNRSDW